MDPTLIPPIVAILGAIATVAPFLLRAKAKVAESEADIKASAAEKEQVEAGSMKLMLKMADTAFANTNKIDDLYAQVIAGKDREKELETQLADSVRRETELKEVNKKLAEANSIANAAIVDLNKQLQVKELLQQTLAAPQVEIPRPPQ